MKKLLIFLSIIVVIAGCSKNQKTPNAEETQTLEVTSGAVVENKSDEITEESKVATDSDKGNYKNEVAQDPVPQYISESEYDGDELGIVKTLNLYMKAFYERDHKALYKLLSKDNVWKVYDIKKYFVSIDKLDFSVKPNPTPPEDVKPVVLEFRVKYDDSKDVQTDKQMFSFRLEDGAWKLTSIADWWT